MRIGEVLGNDGRFVLLAGPCVIESPEGAEEIAEKIGRTADRLGIDFYFKASWDKANRTKASNYRGPGLEEGLRILGAIKERLGVKIVTDIHEPWQAAPVAQVADMLQIPAFLCRQTDLLKAAADTGRVVNVKKAQFMSPEEMENVVDKLVSFRNERILLCERGTCFGYNDLVVDMAGLVRLAALGQPVIFDATHSVQIGGGGPGHGNSGRREFVPYLARAAMATGVVDGIFMEVHPDPDRALCDGSCMLELDRLERLLEQLLEIRAVGRKYMEP